MPFILLPDAAGRSVLIDNQHKTEKGAVPKATAHAKRKLRRKTKQPPRQSAQTWQTRITSEEHYVAAHHSEDRSSVPKVRHTEAANAPLTTSHHSSLRFTLGYLPELLGPAKLRCLQVESSQSEGIVPATTDKPEDNSLGRINSVPGRSSQPPIIEDSKNRIMTIPATVNEQAATLHRRQSAPPTATTEPSLQREPANSIKPAQPQSQAADLTTTDQPAEQPAVMRQDHRRHVVVRPARAFGKEWASTHDKPNSVSAETWTGLTTSTVQTALVANQAATPLHHRFSIIGQRRQLPKIERTEAARQNEAESTPAEPDFQNLAVAAGTSILHAINEAFGLPTSNQADLRNRVSVEAAIADNALAQRNLHLHATVSIRITSRSRPIQRRTRRRQVPRARTFNDELSQVNIESLSQWIDEQLAALTMAVKRTKPTNYPEQRTHLDQLQLPATTPNSHSNIKRSTRFEGSSRAATTSRNHRSETTTAISQHVSFRHKALDGAVQRPSEEPSHGKQNNRIGVETTNKVELDDTPGPSGLQQHQPQRHRPALKQSAVIKKQKKGSRVPILPHSEATEKNETEVNKHVEPDEAADRNPDDNTAGPEPREPEGFSFNDLPPEVQRIIAEQFLEATLPNHSQLEQDFATLMQVLAYNGQAEKYIGEVHTVAIVRDYIILLRSDNSNDAYIFQWRKRSSWIALKIMATLREAGFWTCKRIKIYDTSPMPPRFPNAIAKSVTAVTHDHLAKLLTRFGATKEVKLTECPLFWGIQGIGSLRQLTTSLHSTPAIRGVPDSTWMPDGNGSGTHAQPRLLRLSDALSFISAGLEAYNVQRMQARTTHWSSYAAEASLPSTHLINPRRTASVTTEAAMPTLQISAWKLHRIAEQLRCALIPKGFSTNPCDSSQRKANT